MATLTQERAKAYFDYNPHTGNLHTKERQSSEFTTKTWYTRHINSVGSVVGCPNNGGYIKVYVGGGVYHSAHRVAWVIMTGEWLNYPEFEIDHVDGDRSNNRWDNLRKVTKSQNQRNTTRRANNTTGVAGVDWMPSCNRWRARIWDGPHHKYLGRFQTIEEAAEARRLAEERLGMIVKGNGYAV